MIYYITSDLSDTDFLTLYADDYGLGAHYRAAIGDEQHTNLLCEMLFYADEHDKPLALKDAYMQMPFEKSALRYCFETFRMSNPDVELSVLTQVNERCHIVAEQLLRLIKEPLYDAIQSDDAVTASGVYVALAQRLITDLVGKTTSKWDKGLK